MPTLATLPYLRAAHRRFADEGPAALRIEALARDVGKNESSFYHYFGDLGAFTEALLDYHDARFSEAVAEEAAAVDATGLAAALLAHRETILFSRQLLLHAGRPVFRACFERNAERAIPPLLPLWAELVGLPERTRLAESVLRLSLENFFLRLHPATLTEAWLTDYLRDLHHLVGRLLQRSGGANAASAP